MGVTQEQGQTRPYHGERLKVLPLLSRYLYHYSQYSEINQVQSLLTCLVVLAPYGANLRQIQSIRDGPIPSPNLSFIFRQFTEKSDPENRNKAFLT